MKTISLLEKLKEKATFTTIDLQRILNSNKKYAQLRINRLLKNKYISRVTNGTYTCNLEIEQIASNIVYPSYIGGWYASYYKGYTEQIVNQITIFTKVNKKQIFFQNYKIKFIKTNYLFGYYKENEFFIVDDNKLLIDAVLYSKEFGNIDEIIKIAKNGSFNKETMIDYLNKINKISVNKKIGYLLEKYQNIDLHELIKTDLNYVNIMHNKLKNKKWKII
jgi:predicted transcriptional regulator of viral defense system